MINLIKDHHHSTDREYMEAVKIKDKIQVRAVDTMKLSNKDRIRKADSKKNN